jgi:ubiquinone/menaquinone biosynthesis C-methylase UbiE
MNERTFKHTDAHRLEDPARREYLPTGDLIAKIELEPGMCVADIGAGTGYFALPIAGAVGPEGKVFAVDLQPEMLELLRAKIPDDGATSPIEMVKATAHQTSLAPESCDRVLMANLWHELDDHAESLAEAARILKPGGRLAILDWRTGVERPPGPPLEDRVSMENAVHTLEHAGWSIHHAGDFERYSYLIVATLTDQSVQS